jgi:hypothetical protein
MLGIKFFAMTVAMATITQFGVDAVSPALLNGDLLALGASPPAVPAVSLGHATALKRFCADLFRVVRALIWSTTFSCATAAARTLSVCGCCWCTLCCDCSKLSAAPRTISGRSRGGAVVVGGLARPKGKALNVFATGDDEEERVCALFGRPADGRTFTAPGSSINRNAVTRRRAEAGVVAQCVDADR